ncbi:MAG TPA: hypothetical protein VGD60_10075 [Candidatus Acidoferrales bacterium]
MTVKKLSGILLALSLGLATVTVASAQETSMDKAPPKVLNVVREVLKPGKGGAAHERTESAFVRAMTAAKATDHYFALDALTGPSRTLFLSGYESFADLEKIQREEQANATLSDALDRAGQADGDLLQSYETSTYVLNKEQSNAGADGLVGARYFEIEVFRIKPGHESDWDAAVKLVIPALAKANPDDHWAMYDRVYGGPFMAVVMRPLKSAAEIDQSFASDPKFAAALGEDGRKKLSELSAAAIESSETNLFVINPRISYVGAEMMAADPTFWKPARAAAPAAEHKKPAEKPAQ